VQIAANNCGPVADRPSWFQRFCEEKRVAAEQKKAVLFREQEIEKEIRCISDKIGLCPTRRPENLRLLRTRFGEQQGDFVRMLGIGSQSYYSMIENGKATLDDHQARAIESNLSLPLGWLDRDNSIGLLYLSNDEYMLIHMLKRLEPAVTKSLVELLTRTH